MRALLILPLVLLACGGESSDVSGADPSAAIAEGSVGGDLYGEAAAEDVCDVLTPELVSEATGVPVAELDGPTSPMSGSCRYDTDEGSIQIKWVRAHETAEAARRHFESAYQSRSAEEVAELTRGIDEELARQAEEGEITGEQAEDAGALGGAIEDSQFAGGMQFEDVEGPGDLARYEGGVSDMQVAGMTVTTYTSTLHVLDENLTFDAEAVVAEDEAANREATLALAEAYLAALDG